MAVGGAGVPAGWRSWRRWRSRQFLLELAGFGGIAFGPPPAGTVLPPFLQNMLNLTDEQKKSLADVQKHVDTELAKLLTGDATQDLKNPASSMVRRPGGGPAAAARRRRSPGGGRPGRRRWCLSAAAGGILLAAAASGSGGGPGFGGPGGFGGGGNDFLSKARADLKAVLDDPAHSAADVQAKVRAVRDAVDRACHQLKAAQDELLEVVTADQAVILMSLGYLDILETK